MKVNLTKLRQTTCNKQKIYDIQSKPIPKELRIDWKKFKQTEVNQIKLKQTSSNHSQQITNATCSLRPKTKYAYVRERKRCTVRRLNENSRQRLKNAYNVHFSWNLILSDSTWVRVCLSALCQLPILWLSLNIWWSSREYLLFFV